jgi:8-oxo-dGTP pyrophosphatase MutT (NUDIX family)
MESSDLKYINNASLILRGVDSFAKEAVNAAYDSGSKSTNVGDRLLLVPLALDYYAQCVRKALGGKVDHHCFTDCKSMDWVQCVDKLDATRQIAKIWHDDSGMDGNALRMLKYWMKHKPIQDIVVGCSVLVHDDEQYLVIKEREKLLNLPGGKIEPDDKSILSALFRELGEECPELLACIGPHVGKPYIHSIALEDDHIAICFLFDLPVVNIGRFLFKNRIDLNKVNEANCQLSLKRIGNFQGCMKWVQRVWLNIRHVQRLGLKEATCFSAYELDDLCAKTECSSMVIPLCYSNWPEIDIEGQLKHAVYSDLKDVGLGQIPHVSQWFLSMPISHLELVDAEKYGTPAILNFNLVKKEDARV